jgi:hypothetical protein
MKLVDYLASRKYEKRMRCDVYGQKFTSIAETETHRREAHPNAPPAKERIE